MHALELEKICNFYKSYVSFNNATMQDSFFSLSHIYTIARINYSKM